VRWRASAAAGWPCPAGRVRSAASVLPPQQGCNCCAAGACAGRCWLPHTAVEAACPPLGQTGRWLTWLSQRAIRPQLCVGVASRLAAHNPCGAGECVAALPPEASASHGRGDQGRSMAPEPSADASQRGRGRGVPTMQVPL
jgi:hypothetical protein